MILFLKETWENSFAFSEYTVITCFVSVLAARLMHKYNAHGATDVTGFGLLGHAQNLAKHQKNEVSFVIHNLPVIAKMSAVAKACGNMFQLLQGHSAETSGTPRTFFLAPVFYVSPRQDFFFANFPFYWLVTQFSDVS